jgi:hypothetical protein
MKQRRKTMQIQTELFCQPGLNGVPIPLDLAPDRERELKKVIAELLLNVALDNAGAPRGGECDE